MTSDCLVLNSTYEPLNITTLARAVRLVFAGKAEVLHDRAGRSITSTSFSMPLPSIIRMLYMVNRHKKRVALTKKNVLLRDDYTCQYCGMKGDRTMTVDHILPKRQGGKSSWENLAAACSPCNQRKSDRTPQEARMNLRRKPKEPRHIPFLVIKRNTADDEWTKYLSLWSVSIEERIR